MKYLVVCKRVDSVWFPIVLLALSFGQEQVLVEWHGVTLAHCRLTGVTTTSDPRGGRARLSSICSHTMHPALLSKAHIGTPGRAEMAAIVSSVGETVAWVAKSSQPGCHPHTDAHHLPPSSYTKATFVSFHRSPLCNFIPFSSWKKANEKNGNMWLCIHVLMMHVINQALALSTDLLGPWNNIMYF